MATCVTRCGACRRTTYFSGDLQPAACIVCGYVAPEDQPEPEPCCSRCGVTGRPLVQTDTTKGGDRWLSCPDCLVGDLRDTALPRVLSLSAAILGAQRLGPAPVADTIPAPPPRGCLRLVEARV